MTVITEPGVYDIPELDYHADPVPGGSMSSSTARRILAPGCPALVEWERTHPVFKDAYDLGSVAHRMVLGAGCELVEVEHDSWRTTAAKDARDEARERGAVALLSKDMRAAAAMAAAVRSHPIAGALLAEGTGIPEQSVFWQDADHGIWRRAMLDWFPVEGPGRPIAVDLKTCDKASPQGIQKSVANYGYHQQAAWYLDGLEAVGFADAAFLFVFVEKDPPHLVTVVELDRAAIEEGHARNQDAMRAWVDCRTTNHWPAYVQDIALIGLPRWATTNKEYAL